MLSKILRFFKSKRKVKNESISKLHHTFFDLHDVEDMFCAKCAKSKRVIDTEIIIQRNRGRFPATVINSTFKLSCKHTVKTRR